MPSTKNRDERAAKNDQCGNLLLRFRVQVEECPVDRASGRFVHYFEEIFFIPFGAREASQESRFGAPYRGFSPDKRLFLNDAGIPYVVHCLEVEGRPRFLCRQMLDTYRKIFKRINIHGPSALTLRRTFACCLDARGADEEQIGLILGITEKQAVRKLLPRRPDMVELMTDLYTDGDFSPPTPFGGALAECVAR